jgi:acetolactate synthase-1/2/3 large subunit
MSTITGGEAVYRALKAAQVDCVFGIPSQHNLGLYDALRAHGDIRVVGARHEQGAVHAADGYARATGRLGVAIVSTGPGTTNAITGLYEAGFASSRVLLITTQIDACYLGKGKGFIHEAEQQLAMLRTVVRSAERAHRAEEIEAKLYRVIADILSGRPQPGAVEIPTDFLVAEIADQPVAYLAPQPLAPAAASVAAAVELLARARRPLLWIGGGCNSPGAAAEVLQLAEQLGAPVVSSLNGRGVVPHDHPLYVGCQTHLPPFRALFAEADLVLAIGTRFQALASQYWRLPMPAQLIHLDADAGVIGRNFPTAVAMVGDAKLGAAALLQQLRPAPAIDPDFGALARQTRAAAIAAVDIMIGPDHRQLVDVIADLLPADSPVVCDATMPGNTWGNFLLPVRRPRCAHYSTSLAIGPALPLGIGAAVGTGRKTLIIHGDGGVMLHLPELAAAAEAGAPIILCVFNDGGYGVLRDLQRYGGRPAFGVKLHTPDFAAIARAMGGGTATAATAASFAEALRAALAHDGPYLIEIEMNALSPIDMFRV